MPSDDEQPVVDRIILTPKKNKALPPEAPVVDRIILTPKKKRALPPPKPPPPPPPVVIARPVPPPEPKPTTRQTDVPEGLLVDFAYKTGVLDGVQLGMSYWFDESWGLGVQNGFESHRGTKTVAYSSGRRRVTGMAWRTAPEISLLFSPAQAKKIRLTTELGGGMHFSKLEREKVARGYQSHLGLGLQWTVIERLSVQVGERLQWVAIRGSETSNDISLATQLSVSWWFE